MNSSPQYVICTGEEKGDYEVTHLWFKERKAFDYFSIISYYPTKDFIYLVGSKGTRYILIVTIKQNGAYEIADKARRNKRTKNALV